MSMRKTKTAACVGAFAALGFGFVQNVAADAYGYSNLDILNFAIQYNGGAAASGSGNVNGIMTATGSGGTFCSGGFGTDVDCPPANGGTAVGTGDNVFSPQGNASSTPGPLGPSFARSDGDVPNGTQATIVSEAQTSAGNQQGNSEYSLAASVIVEDTGPDDSLTFTFDAVKYLETSLDAAVVPLSQAQSSITFQITLTPDDPQGAPAVFEFSPILNGGVSGGTLGASPFTLQTSLLSLNAPGDLKSSIGDSIAGGTQFSATTNDLDPGSYTLSVRSTASVNTVRTTENVVPEPGTLLILSAGLVAVGAARRRGKMVG